MFDKIYNSRELKYKNIVFYFIFIMGTYILLNQRRKRTAMKLENSKSPFKNISF